MKTVKYLFKKHPILAIFAIFVFLITIAGTILYIVFGPGKIWDAIGIVSTILGIATIFPAVAAYIKASDIERRFSEYEGNVSPNEEGAINLAVSVSNAIGKNVGSFISKNENKEYHLPTPDKSVNIGKYFILETYNDLNLYYLFCDKSMPVDDTEDKQAFLKEYKDSVVTLRNEIQPKCKAVNLYVGGPTVILSTVVGNVFSNRCNINLFHWVTTENTYVCMGSLEGIIENK